MRHRRPIARWRRILGIVLCYALALQALLAVHATALAAAQIGAPAELGVICHAGDDTAPDPDGTSKRNALPCTVCATAASALGVLPQAAAISLAPALAGGPIVAALPRPHLQPQHRPGAARAPPAFA